MNTLELIRWHLDWIFPSLAFLIVGLKVNWQERMLTAWFWFPSIGWVISNIGGFSLAGFAAIMLISSLVGISFQYCLLAGEFSEEESWLRWKQEGVFMKLHPKGHQG
jgi:hypothetical protein